MAYIDKTYLTWEDYLILQDWCKNTKLIYDNGIEGSPEDFLFLYDEPYEGDKPVWNTLLAFDKWLYKNCPLNFIQKRLSEQYRDVSYLAKENPILETGIHYTILSKPKINFRYKWSWWIEIVNSVDNDYWRYGFDTHTWYPSYKLMPSEMLSSCCNIKNLTKRRLNKLIKQWKLPIGTILKVRNRYIDSEYLIKIKK